MLRRIPRSTLWLASILAGSAVLLLALSLFEPIEGAFAFIPPLLLGLEMLSVQRTEVTDEGAEKLRRALPKTWIYIH